MAMNDAQKNLIRGQINRQVVDDQRERNALGLEDSLDAGERFEKRGKRKPVAWIVTRDCKISFEGCGTVAFRRLQRIDDPSLAAELGRAEIELQPVYD